jgi:hypothetical protein
MSSPQELSLILEAYRCPSPFGEEGPNAMETMAIASYAPGDKFKHVVVNMRGLSGNALVIVGTVMKALARAGATSTERWIFRGNALSNNYEHVLATVVQWVTVVDEEPERTKDAWTAMVEIVKSKEGL